MKVTIEYDLELDGELDEKCAAAIFFERHELTNNIITSEDVDDVEGKWTIIVKGWEVK